MFHTGFSYYQKVKKQIPDPPKIEINANSCVTLFAILYNGYRRERFECCRHYSSAIKIRIVSGLWLWRSCQCDCFRYQRTQVRIQSMATFIEQLFTVDGSSITAIWYRIVPLNMQWVSQAHFTMFDYLVQLVILPFDLLLEVVRAKRFQSQLKNQWL